MKPLIPLKNRSSSSSIVTRSELRRALLIPIGLLVLYLAFIAIYKEAGLPPQDEVVRRIEEFFAIYGYSVVFIGSLLEGLLVIGWYLPGSMVMVLGVMLSRQGYLNPVAVVGLIIVALYIAVLIDYALGRFGWYRLLIRLGLGDAIERNRPHVQEKGFSIIGYTYLHPYGAGLTATTCGVLKLPFRSFAWYSAIALICWNSFWGVLVYSLGDAARVLLTWQAVLIALVALIIIRILKMIKRNQFGGGTNAE